MQILRPSQNIGRSRDPPPLIFDQTEARRAEKNFFGDSPFISRSGSGTAEHVTDKTAVNFCVELWFPCKIVIHLHVVAEKISFTKLLRLLEYIVDKLFCDEFNDVSS